MNMNTEQFREIGKSLVDYIADYFEKIRERPVLPSVQPGYLRTLIPEDAPQSGESWNDVLSDVERVIMPGVTHWSSPHFHAYYPSANSFPAILGEMLSVSIGCVGFNWLASPACTELEVVMMDWLGKLLHLPEEFLNCSEGPGGGVIQGTASEAILIALLTAKEKKVRLLKHQNSNLSESDIKGKLVAYSSDQANSAVEKAGLLGSMHMRLLPSDENGKLQVETLCEAIAQDKKLGLIPCYVVSTLGSTGICSFDDLEEIGPICVEEDIWLHVDAAYAGSAFVCPEYLHLSKGIHYANSLNINLHKWMLVNIDCSAMWVKDVKCLVEAFNVDRIYLKHEYQGLTSDYRHWQIPLSRRFRSLKLWFVLRMYGKEGIQNYIRAQINLAKYFAKLVGEDSRFELCTSSMALVCFRLKGDDFLTQQLLNNLMARKKIYVIPCYYRRKLVIRFVVCSRLTEKQDIDFAWSELSSQANEISIVKNNHEVAIQSKIFQKLTLNVADIKMSSESTEKSK